MNRRVRFLGGLVAATAMMLSLAVGVFASACASTVELGASSPAHAHETASADMPDADCMEHMPEEADPPPCPLTPYGAGQSCATVASLPAVTMKAPIGATEQGHSLLFTEREPRVLLGDALFHPPRS